MTIIKGELGMTLKPKYTRFFALILAVLCALPFSFGWINGLFLWTSPLLFLSRLFSRQAFSILAMLGMITLILIMLRHRWYCRWMCPVGVLCDAASRKTRRRLKIPRLAGYLTFVILGAALFRVLLPAMLDPLVILHTFFDGLQKQSKLPAMIKISGLFIIVGVNFISAHIWCQKLCPLGGLQEIVSGLKNRLLKHKPAKLNVGRRAAIGSMSGFVLAILFKNGVANADVIRPPAALPEDEFQSACLRCGNCIKACPTRVLETSFSPHQPAGLFTPHVQFSEGYCLPECTNCGKVCPSGAIRPFSKEDKKSLVMGVAHIELDDCLLSKHKECDRCKFYCEYDAISIGSTDFDFNPLPKVIESKCVGCGACVAACPVSVISIHSV